MKKKTDEIKIIRTEVFSVRIDPQLRFMVEVAARLENRSLSSFIECAAQTVLKETNFDGVSFDVLSKTIWSPVESRRFCNMLIYGPHLLSPEEQLLWETIKLCKFVEDNVVYSLTLGDKPIYGAIHQTWAQLHMYLSGTTTFDQLKQYIVTNVDHLSNWKKLLAET